MPKIAAGRVEKAKHRGTFWQVTHWANETLSPAIGDWFTVTVDKTAYAWHSWTDDCDKRRPALTNDSSFD
jgi:hypothetical protein